VTKRWVANVSRFRVLLPTAVPPSEHFAGTVDDGQAPCGNRARAEDAGASGGDRVSLAAPTARDGRRFSAFPRDLRCCRRAQAEKGLARRETITFRRHIVEDSVVQRGSEMSEPMPVELSFTDGPVFLRNGHGWGVSTTCDLWDGIVGSEYFPPTLESASYVIKLNKTVKAAADVRSVEQELIEALLVIAAAWPFSGGANLVLDSRRQIHSRRFESNALVVEQALLKGTGRSRLSGESAMNVESVAAYAQPPLSSAARIGQHARTDFRSWQLLHYYQRAYADKSLWLIHLYKIADVLKRLHGTSAKRTQFGIESTDWQQFERLLNTHDLRHASERAKQPPISAGDITRVFEIARQWILTYLRTQRLPVV
jgi:hypothetical protein